MAGTDVLERLDALYRTYLVQERWQDAVQNRGRSAMLARQLGRTDLFCQYSQQAITVAEANHLEHLELRTRVARYQTLLMQDLTDSTLDELAKDLKCKPGKRGTLDLTGSLSEKLERYASEALAAYDQALTSSVNPSAATIEAVKLAGQKATAFSLVVRAGQFEEVLELLSKETDLAEVGKQIRAVAEGARSDTSRICDGLRVDLYLLT